MTLGPLWMPAGSVRSILSLLVIGSIPFMMIKKIDIPAEYWGFAGTVIALYFGNRNGENKEDTAALNEELKALKASSANITDQILKQNASLADTAMKAGLPIAVLPQVNQNNEE